MRLHSQKKGVRKNDTTASRKPVKAYRATKTGQHTAKGRDEELVERE